MNTLTHLTFATQGWLHLSFATHSDYKVNTDAPCERHDTATLFKNVFLLRSDIKKALLFLACEGAGSQATFVDTLCVCRESNTFWGTRFLTLRWRLCRQVQHALREMCSMRQSLHSAPQQNVFVLATEPPNILPKLRSKRRLA